jgi:hypothetical protein
LETEAGGFQLVTTAYGFGRQERWKGCAPSFSAHVRWGEHGAPVQGRGPRFLLQLRGAVDLVYRQVAWSKQPGPMEWLRSTARNQGAATVCLPCVIAALQVGCCAAPKGVFCTAESPPVDGFRASPDTVLARKLAV